jgi:hypothetical protein
MRAAFAIWDDRIAPVFDVSRELRVVDADLATGRIASDRVETLAPDLLPLDRAQRLDALGVEVLVCGAISRPLQAQIAGLGVTVHPFVAGEAGPVVQAWLTGVLDRDQYTMPGCCGRARRGRRRGGGAGGDDPGQGPGGGRGRGGGRGHGGGPAGDCVCPGCGHREPHQRGVPCQQRRCPGCGTPLTREPGPATGNDRRR